MSILNGSVSGESIFPEQPPFGSELESVKFFPLSQCGDVEVDENAEYAFALHSEGVTVYDIKNPSNPVCISTLGGITAAREIRIEQGYAYIVARESGLYIADFTDVRHPRIVAQYDTLELASGVDAADGLCFAANRHLGVEIIDVSNPENPLFISSFLCGEAQSVFACGGYLYVGDWMNKQVHIVDISDPKTPETVSVLRVDGFADGVFVLDNICYVATGQHSARLKNRRKFDKYPYITPEMALEGYGCGHGLEIFDVSDKAHPEWISSVKFPPLYATPDIWKVKVSGGTAYVADSNNGFFAVNVVDLHNPYIEAYFRDKPSPWNGVQPPIVQMRRGPIVNFSCVNGFLYLAGMESGFWVVKYEKSRKIRRNPAYSERIGKSAYRAKSFFECGGQIHSMAQCGEFIIAAAGNAGLLALDAEGKICFTAENTGKIIYDVKCKDGFIFSTEGQDGTAVYSFDTKCGFTLTDRFISDDGVSARTIAALGDGLLAVQLGIAGVDFYSVSESGKISKFEHIDDWGMLYYRNICQPLLKGGYFGYSSLKNGVSWCKISDKSVVKSEYSLSSESCPIETGFAVSDSGDYAVIIHHQQYAVLSDIERADLSSLEFSRINGARLNGIPFICGSKLVLLNRCHSFAEIIDITDLRNPVFEEKVMLAGNPSFALLAGERIYIVCGHAGVYTLEKCKEM